MSPETKISSEGSTVHAMASASTPRKHVIVVIGKLTTVPRQRN